MEENENRKKRQEWEISATVKSREKNESSRKDRVKEIMFEIK